jgi:hypothetical protein
MGAAVCSVLAMVDVSVVESQSQDDLILRVLGIFCFGGGI